MAVEADERLARSHACIRHRFRLAMHARLFVQGTPAIAIPQLKIC